MWTLDRRAVAVVGIGLLLFIGGLWWLCERDNQVPFLAGGGHADWIVCPMAPDAVEHDAAKVFASFRGSLKIEAVRVAKLRVRAFREGVVSINGRVVDEIELSERDWKRTREAEVGKYLKAGENEILVTVTNSLGPPAVWAELEAGGRSPGTEQEWDVSVLNGNWQKAARASQPPAILAGNPLFGKERAGDSLGRCWVRVVVIVLIAAAAVGGLAWTGNKMPNETAETQRNAEREGTAAKERKDHEEEKAKVRGQKDGKETEGRRHDQPDRGGGREREGGGRAVWVLVAISVVWVVLFVDNLPQLPGLFGFDRDGHLYYIDYIQQKKALPLADEGWQTYQPPLYYLIGAVVTAPFKWSEAAQRRDWHDLGKLPEWHGESALVALRSLSAIFGLAHVFLVFAALRRIFPGQGGPQIVGLVLAGFLPANIYLSHHVTNEGLSALFVTAALYFCIRIITGAPKEEASGHREWVEYVAVGTCLGLAMLTKFSALLAIPVVLVAVAWSSLRGGIRFEQEKTEKTEARKSLFPLFSLVRKATCLNIGLLLVSMAAVCGWHYLRVWIHFGKPLVGNWDPKLPIIWWQEPGFHTAAWYWRFGQSLVSPLYSGISGFGDGLYSSLWGDGLCSGATGMQFRPPWDYDLMNACYLFSLIPTALIIVGVVVFLSKFLRGPNAIGILVLGLGAAFASGVLLMALKIPSYAQVKAFYALPILVVMCALAGKGWAFFARASRWAGGIMSAGLLGWGLLVICAFWIRSGSLQTQTARGLEAISADRFSEAEERLSRVLHINSEYAPARIGLINVLRETGRLQEAQREAESMIAAHPENPDGYFQLGLGLQAAGKEEEAIEQFRRAKGLAPQHLGAYQHLALSLSSLKRWQEAVKIYKEGLCVYPLSFELLNNLAWLRATSADAAERKGTEAVLLAQTACELTSYERPVLIGTLAAAYAQAGRFADAVSAAERARLLALAMGQGEVAKKNAELEELYRAGRAYVEEN